MGSSLGPSSPEVKCAGYSFQSPFARLLPPYRVVGFSIRLCRAPPQVPLYPSYLAMRCRPSAILMFSVSTEQAVLGGPRSQPCLSRSSVGVDKDRSPCSMPSVCRWRPVGGLSAVGLQLSRATATVLPCLISGWASNTMRAHGCAPTGRSRYGDIARVTPGAPVDVIALGAPSGDGLRMERFDTINTADSVADLDEPSFPISRVPGPGRGRAFRNPTRAPRPPLHSLFSSRRPQR